MSVKLQLCLLAQKMYPQWCWLLFESAGLKECARDVGVVMAVFAGSKKYTRNNIGCSLCLRVQKNAPAMSVKSRLCLWVQKNVSAIVLVALCVCGFKKMHPRRCLLLFESAGSKKYTRNNVGCYLCLWVQKNAPADRVEWLCVKCCHALLLAA